MDRIKIIRADITTLQVDAVVNAANNALLGGGGVDGAIHRAAGHGLLKACQKLNGCETGEAKITKGYQLKAKYIIHTVGPVWHGGEYREADLLARCYESSLALAVDNHVDTIAFPAISCGVYGFPIKIAAEIAIREVSAFLKKNYSIQTVYLVCFDEDVFNFFQAELKKQAKENYAVSGSAWNSQTDHKEKLEEKKKKESENFDRVFHRKRTQDQATSPEEKKKSSGGGGFFK